MRRKRRSHNVPDQTASMVGLGTEELRRHASVSDDLPSPGAVSSRMVQSYDSSPAPDNSGLPPPDMLLHSESWKATGSSQPTSPREEDQFDIYFYRSADATAGLGNRNLQRTGQDGQPQIITQYHNLEIITKSGEALHGQTVVLLEALGEGTFADCYKAEYNGRVVAVKILKANLHPVKQREAFDRELLALRKTANSELTLDLIGYRPPPHYWIITPYMNQGTLHARIKAAKGRPLDVHTVLDISIQICSAMLHLHSQQLMHRDLTPFNVLFHDGALRLCDFGVSVDLTNLPNATIPAKFRLEADHPISSFLPHHLPEGGSSAAAPATSRQYDRGYLTSSQIISPQQGERDGDEMHLEGDDGDELEMDVELALTHELDYHLSPNGHPYYRAPEVNEGHAYSLSAEVYNFGSVLYECMTGVVLLAQEPQVLPRSPGTEALRRSAERRGGGFPDELWCLQAACWARDPRKRPSFAALLDRLTALQLALAL